MATRACVYSVLVGGYETLVEQPVARSSDVDFILFSDDRALTSDTWQIRYEPLVLPEDPARSSRRAKVLPHAALPEYDLSLYVDNRVVLLKPPEVIFAELLPDDAAFVVNAHDHRETVRDEFAAVVSQEVDAPWICAEQLDHYESRSPEVLKQKPLWTGFMIRRHHDELLKRANEIWWTHLLRYSRRDQLSINMALHESGLQPTLVFNDARRSEYHEWLHAEAVERVTTRSGRPAGMKELKTCQEERDRTREQLRVLREQYQRESTAAAQTAAALRAHNAGLRRARDELLNTTSWRLTGPLRWLGDRKRGRS